MRIPKNVKKWLEALRSGEYKQGQGKLCTEMEDGVKEFCCLGVYLDVNHPEITYVVLENGDREYEMGKYSTISIVPESISVEFTPKSKDCDEFMNDLANRNDGFLDDNIVWSFTDIADYIEETWKNENP